MGNQAIKQARQRLRPQKYQGEVYKMWLKAQELTPSEKYRQYVLCDPIPREDQAPPDSIAQEARK